MVRVGGLRYAIEPNAAQGKRISRMQLLDGRQIEADRKYKVAGWAPVTEEAKAAGTEPIWDTVARFMKARTIIKPRKVNVPELIGVGSNPGIG